MNEGDEITLNGTAGKVYKDELPLIETDITSDYLTHFLGLCDNVRRLKGKNKCRNTSRC